MNQLEAFIENFERSLYHGYQDLSDATATPSDVLLAVRIALRSAREHLHDECSGKLSVDNNICYGGGIAHTLSSRCAQKMNMTAQRSDSTRGSRTPAIFLRGVA